MRRAFILPARHDERIAEAQRRAADPSLSIYERSIAEKEWQALWLRRRLERICVALRIVSRFSIPFGIAIAVVWFRPDRSVAIARPYDYFPMLICGLASGILSALAIGFREALQRAIAQRYPSHDD